MVTSRIVMLPRRVNETLPSEGKGQSKPSVPLMENAASGNLEVCIELLLRKPSSRDSSLVRPSTPTVSTEDFDSAEPFSLNIIVPVTSEVSPMASLRMLRRGRPTFANDVTRCRAILDDDSCASGLQHWSDVFRGRSGATSASRRGGRFRGRGGRGLRRFLRSTTGPHNQQRERLSDHGHSFAN